MKRKITMLIGTAALCAVMLAGCGSSDPVEKYLRSFDKGDSAAASEIYTESIKDDSENKAALQTKLNERMDAIYEDFRSGKITAAEAKEKLAPYKEYDPSSLYAFTTLGNITLLQESNDAYQDAVDAEADGNLSKAIAQYSKVIEADPNYETAQTKLLQLREAYTETMKNQAQQQADAKDYDAAIHSIQTLASVIGSSDELNALIQQYSELKNYRYVRVVCTDKGVLPKNTSAWRFSNYVTFVFDVTNNSDKTIKGVQGVLHIKDMFGTSIIDVGCDFSGYTVQPGETYTDSSMSLDVNEFIDSHMKLYNTAYSDLIFEYEPSMIVFTDGTSVTIS